LISTRRFTSSEPPLAWLEAGGGEDPVVFLHGVGSSASTWQELFPRLGTDRRLVAPDLRGHGSSGAGTVPYRLADFVDDHICLLDELGLGSTHVVGFSLGAVIAQAIALAHPERVSSLVLLNCIGGRTGDETARALRRLEAIRTTDPAVGVGQSIGRWFTPAFIRRRPDLVEREAAIVSVTAPIPYGAAYEVLATTDLIDEIHAISSPTLLVTGELDVGSTPRMSTDMQTRIPGAELAVVDGLKHYLHVEAAAQVAGLISGFLARRTDAPPPSSPSPSSPSPSSPSPSSPSPSSS
jgi:pimeloyl-ACP methyl ester carboxylesterase